MIDLTTETLELKVTLRKEIENLLWFLSYNYMKLNVDEIQKSIEDVTSINQYCQLKRLTSTSYKLRGIRTRTINVVGHLKTDITNLLYGLITVLTGIEDELLLSYECQDMEGIINATIKLGLSDYKEQQESSKDLNYYYNNLNPYLTLAQLEEDRLSSIANL